MLFSGSDYEECAICCDACTEDDEAAPTVVTGCKHRFHSYCLRKWNVQCREHGLAFSCPVCRGALKQDLNIENKHATGCPYTGRMVSLASPPTVRASSVASTARSISWPSISHTDPQDEFRRHPALAPDFLDLDVAQGVYFGAVIDLDGYMG
eukprot:CAMPEP_0115843744 /NCGR_PEP_ID=MMETSP0287-20121206/8472_1 /TAXON_ID=412157 /ORGANISM="Chrysochromulina rotalis, Strain UIO044" /LENGTH=151 /DNA_ID=CAMNT_0003297451 /DNA_START=108 /DNA_END=563 /DNA_ORIENTATION=-